MQESNKENAGFQEPHEQSNECSDSDKDNLLSPFTFSPNIHIVLYLKWMLK